MGTLEIVTFATSWYFKGPMYRKGKIEVDCEGNGLKEDPYILDKSIYSAIGRRYLEIQNSKKFVVIQNWRRM